MGMQQLTTLSSAFRVQYEFALNVLTDRIVEEAKAQRLEPLKTLDFDAITSAWDVEKATNPQSHTQGKISKTCFVFVSSNGWDWAPYEGSHGQVGALAQKITGELGLKYEEIPCDASLPQKLKEANDSDVPTILFGDPNSLHIETYAQPMRQYDSQYLLNCAALVAWDAGVKDTIDTDPRWIRLKKEVFKQKAENPPPYHEWRSVFSQGDLNLKTRTMIELIRSRLMAQLASDPTKARKADDPMMSRNAAALGIETASLPHLEGPRE
jgi:hypothetical protein